MAAENERAMGPAVQNNMPNSVPLNPEQPSTTNYTIPGILHFIKHEWSRFEKEKANWEVERAELQVLKVTGETLTLTHSAFYTLTMSTMHCLLLLQCCVSSLFQCIIN